MLGIVIDIGTDRCLPVALPVVVVSCRLCVSALANADVVSTASRLLVAKVLPLPLPAVVGTLNFGVSR